MMNKNLILIGIIGIMFLCQSCGDNDFDKAKSLFSNGQYQEALAIYNDYITVNPNDLSAIYNRGRTYEELGQYDKAVEDFKKVLSVDPKDVAANLSLAKNYYRDKDYAKAKYLLDEVMQDEKNNYDAYVLRGRSLAQLGEWEEALSDYKQAIVLNQNDAAAYYYRGLLKVALKKRKIARGTSACSDFEQAERLGFELASEQKKEHC